MAASPPKDEDIEQNQSGEDDGGMSRHDDIHGGLGDFEVKEQDRWLPIANGWFTPVSFYLFACYPKSCII